MFVSMVINCPTLLDIYIESVSQLVLKKSLGIIKIRAINIFAIVPFFFCHTLTKFNKSETRRAYLKMLRLY